VSWLGEAAFHKILAWTDRDVRDASAGTEPARTITKSYNALLLETAQALDEARVPDASAGDAKGVSSPLAALSQVEGVEFILAMKPGEKNVPEARGWRIPNG